jgi:CDP-diacylglycerol--glycerol-3-phosphate 3-phosphatidyltransferase
MIMANMITLLRVLLSFMALLLANKSDSLNLIAMIIIAISLLLDAADGYLARYLKTSTLEGSIYDILADRIIENSFFIYFATMGLFNVWFAIVMIVRGLTIDAVRTLHATTGKTAFGETTFHKAKWAKFVTGSKLSRGLYNSLKLITFVFFTALLSPNNVLLNWMSWQLLQNCADIFLWLTLGLAILRAIPVIIEGTYSYQIERVEE